MGGYAEGALVRRIASSVVLTLAALAVPGLTAGAAAAVPGAAAPGGQLWVSAYNGPASGNDVASGAAVSPGGGTVYVTGTSYSGPAAGYDYRTVAYNGATGARLWVARYNGPANSTDSPHPGGRRRGRPGRAAGRRYRLPDRDRCGRTFRLSLGHPCRVRRVRPWLAAGGHGATAPRPAGGGVQAGSAGLHPVGAVRQRTRQPGWAGCRRQRQDDWRPRGGREAIGPLPCRLRPRCGPGRHHGSRRRAGGRHADVVAG